MAQILDPINTLTLTLAVLSMFFTLITGAFAIFVTWAIFYFGKLKNEREDEIKKLNVLQDDLLKKIKEAEGLSGGSLELEEIKKSFQELRNQFFHITVPTGYSGNSGSVVSDLTSQINSLLATIAALQTKLAELQK